MMNRRFFLSLCVALSALFTSCKEKANSTPKEASQSLKIAAWNLQWFPGKIPDGGTPEEQEAHVKAVVNELKVIDADILLLQEIRDTEVLRDIAKKELPDYSLDIISDFEGNLEVAILSKAPYRANDSYMEGFYRANTIDPPRGFVAATVKLDESNMLAVYSVHLKSNSGGIEETTPKREESARQLITFNNNLKERAKSHNMNLISVIGGDFNSDPTSDNWADDKTLSILINEGFKWTGKNTAQEDRISWLSDGRYPDACFDHIMVSAPEGFVVSDSVTHKTTRDISDHRAVVAVLKTE